MDPPYNIPNYCSITNDFLNTACLTLSLLSAGLFFPFNITGTQRHKMVIKKKNPGKKIYGRALAS
jgi:hypothetical protein